MKGDLETNCSRHAESPSWKDDDDTVGLDASSSSSVSASTSSTAPLMLLREVNLNQYHDDIDDSSVSLHSRSLLVSRSNSHDDDDTEDNKNKTEEEQQWNRNNNNNKVWKLCFGAAGIYAVYLYHGTLEEDLYRYRSDKGTKFTHVWLLQVLECAAAISVGVVGRRVFGSNQNNCSFTAISRFFLPGFSQVLAKACTALSLSAGLSFPVVVLAKSCKVAPIMFGQIAVGGARYTFRDYLFVALIVCGTALLCSGGESTTNKNLQEDNEKESSLLLSSSTPTGIAFIILSLVMDGFTAGLQKRIQRSTSNNPLSAYDFLVFTNLSMIFIALSISISTGDFINGRSFLLDNPVAFRTLVQCCLCSAVGQTFIFYIISIFDPLVLSTVTTTRKILTVLLSILFKGHHLTGQGCVGLVMALSGLVIEVGSKVNGPESSTGSNNDDGSIGDKNHRR